MSEPLRSSEPTCETCQFWKRMNIGAGKEGYCRIRSTVPDFPDRWANEWCGEHKPELSQPDLRIRSREEVLETVADQMDAMLAGKVLVTEADLIAWATILRMSPIEAEKVLTTPTDTVE